MLTQLLQYTHLLPFPLFAQSLTHSHSVNSQEKSLSGNSRGATSVQV